MQNSTLLKGYIVMIQTMKSTTLLINKMIIKTTWDPAILVVAHTLYGVAMNQYAIGADQTWTAIHQLNVLGKKNLTGNKNKSP